MCSSGEESDEVDEEMEGELPICVQGTLTRLRKRNKNLRKERNLLKAKLISIEEEMEGMKVELPGCQLCVRLKTEVEELKEKLSKDKMEDLSEDKETSSDTVDRQGWMVDSGLEEGEVQSGEELSLAEQVRQTAESALIQQGMVYEPVSGLYWHQQSGYYFDAERSLYYDGNSGTWYRYDSESKEYTVYSSAPEEELAAHRELQRRKKEEEKERKRLKAEMKQFALGNSGLDSNCSSENSDSDSEPLVDSTLPCVRVVVQESQDPKVRPGSLYIVTVQGGTIGSQGQHDVLLPDAACSKQHARFTFNEQDVQYSLKDLGSRNGTWVNGKRMSESKVESSGVVVGHGTQVRIGNTVLVCHIHPGRETCLQCEPGVVGEKSQEERDEEEQRKRQEMAEVLGRHKSRRDGVKMIKRKYGLGREGGGRVRVGEQYSDRAGERRKLQGSDCPGEKTDQASVHTEIRGDNKGRKMMEKMGWDGGGLGLEGGGREEPVLVEQRVQGVGLGCDLPVQVELGKGVKRKTDIWKKTQKRFKDTPVLDAFTAEDTDDDEAQS